MFHVERNWKSIRIYCFVLSFILALVGCQNEVNNASKLSVEGTLNPPQKDSLKNPIIKDSNGSKSITDTCPSEHFVRLVKYLNSLGYMQDTTKLLKSSGYFMSAITPRAYFTFRGFQFFKLDTLKDLAFSENRNLVQGKRYSLDCFKIIKDINGYFFSRYFGKLHAYGLVIEWKFKTDRIAQMAWQEMDGLSLGTENFMARKNRPAPMFFNSLNTIFRIKNYVYTIVSPCTYLDMKFFALFKDIKSKYKSW